LDGISAVCSAEKCLLDAKVIFKNKVVACEPDVMSRPAMDFIAVVTVEKVIISVVAEEAKTNRRQKCVS
jgi:hypothetical protein